MKIRYIKYGVMLLSVTVIIACHNVNEDGISLGEAHLPANITAQSFAKEKKSPQQYVAWLETPDNGLNISKQVGAYNFNLQYKPAEYIIFKEQNQTPFISEQEMDSLSAELKDMQYYTLKIAADGVEDPLRYNTVNDEEFREKTEYFSFGMQHDLFILEGKDTMHCRLQHFERTFGATPYCTVLLGFETNSKKTIMDKVFVFNDQMLGSGPVKMIIEADKLNNIPGLKLK